MTAGSLDVRYLQAFTDWLACACAGRDEPAARAARAAGSGLWERVVAAGTAGHVLDFDDTYTPGLVHLSAPTAPAALVLGAELGADLRSVLAAYAAGFEAMAAVAAASHPHLYERGWHPTAVTGTVGAAVAASRLLGLEGEAARTAPRLALLGAGGLRAAFGSDGKSLQVGMAAAQGVRGALLAAEGASVPEDAAVSGFAAAYGGNWAEPGEDRVAVAGNWIKAYPCCLQTHTAIEAAATAAAAGADPDGSALVTVHPRSRQAAPFDDVDDGLQAKFSIPYTVALTVLHGPPSVADFAAVDEAARTLARRVEVGLDGNLGESEAVLEWRGGPQPMEVRVVTALGSPQRPMSEEQLTSKVRSLAGARLEGLLDDPSRPAADLLTAVALA